MSHKIFLTLLVLGTMSIGTMLYSAAAPHFHLFPFETYIPFYLSCILALPLFAFTISLREVERRLTNWAAMLLFIFFVLIFLFPTVIC
jgi:hypothetical protein